MHHLQVIVGAILVADHVVEAVEIIGGLIEDRDLHQGLITEDQGVHADLEVQEDVHDHRVVFRDVGEDQYQVVPARHHHHHEENPQAEMLEDEDVIADRQPKIRTKLEFKCLPMIEFNVAFLELLPQVRLRSQ